MKKNFAHAMMLLVVMSLALTACNPFNALPSGPKVIETGKEVVTGVLGSYNDLIAKYQGAQKSASDFSLCVDTSLGKLDRLEKQVSTYLAADVEKTKAYRQAYNNAKSDVEKAQQNYSGSTESLDLAELQKKNALPDTMGGGLTVMVNSLTEAPLAPVSEKVQLSLMDTTNESFNSIQACGVDWNSSVEAYNVTRNQASGDVVGRVAEALKVTTLPQTLPYFKGSGRAIK